MAKKNKLKIEGNNNAPIIFGDNGTINDYSGGNNNENESKKSILETVKTLSEILGNIWPYVLDKIKELLSGILGLVG